MPGWVIRAAPAVLVGVVGALVVALARRGRKEGMFACIAGVAALPFALWPLVFQIGQLWGRTSPLGEVTEYALRPTSWRPVVHSLLAPQVRDVLLVWAVVTAVAAGFALRSDSVRGQRVLGTVGGAMAAVVALLAFGPSVTGLLFTRQVVRDAAARVEATPTDPGARGYYAMWLGNMGRYDDALSEARTARQLADSGDPVYPWCEGIYLLKLGRPEEALEPLRATYELRGKYTEEAAQWIATYESRYQDNDEMPRPFKQVVETRRRQAEDSIAYISTEYAVCFVLLERWEEAADVMGELRKRFPERRWTRSEAILLCRAVGREAELRRELEEWRRLQPEEAIAFEEHLRGVPEASHTRRELREWAEGYVEDR